MVQRTGHIRSIPERLEAYQRNGARTSGLCAEAVMTALNAPRQGLKSAADVWRAVPPAQRHKDNAPRGSIVYWTGGSKGYGHTCLALGDHLELSVDTLPGDAGAAGVVPFAWFGENWPRLRYAGWSWFWGAIDTRPTVLVVSEPTLPGL